MKSYNRDDSQSQIRYHKRSSGTVNAKAIYAILMVLIIIVGVIFYVMSLAGVGLFSEKTSDGEDGPLVTADQGAQGTSPDDTSNVGGQEKPDDMFIYVDKQMSDIVTGDLILVDKEHVYSATAPSLEELGPVSPRRFSLSLYSLSLKPAVIQAIIKMTDDLYTATKYDAIMISDAYRSIEQQQALYNSNPLGAAMPGCSDYHTGASFSITGYKNGGSVSLWGVEGGKWIKDNAHKYGFIFRFPTDKKDITGYNIDGQMRYVGIAHATYMKENNLCLEEYLEKIKEYSYSNKLRVEAEDGIIYDIYYQAAVEDGTSKLKLPKDREYTVSGDNKGGFIVTEGKQKNAK